MVALYSSVDAPSGAHWTETQALLTRWESPEGALHIQQHLVVVLVILSLDSFYKKTKNKKTNDSQADLLAQMRKVAILFTV